MAIVIRHNGALNAAAAGLQEGLSQGLAARDQNDARKAAQEAEDKRLRLAQVVAAANAKLQASQEERAQRDQALQEQSIQGRKDAAAQLGAYAANKGQDPNFQPNYVETADPIEQRMHANAAHTAKIAKLIAESDPSLVPDFLQEAHKAQQTEMLQGMAQREQSAWQSMGTNPTMGPVMAGDGKNQSELGARAKQATDAIKAALEAGDPQALHQAIGLSVAARNESMMQQAKLQDQTAEAQNLTSVYGAELNTMEAALTKPPPGLERLGEVWPMIREQAQAAVSRARLALGAYNTRLGSPNPMTATELHSTVDKAMKDAGEAFKGRGGVGGGRGASSQAPAAKPYTYTDALRDARREFGDSAKIPAEQIRTRAEEFLKQHEDAAYKAQIDAQPEPDVTMRPGGEMPFSEGQGASPSQPQQQPAQPVVKYDAAPPDVRKTVDESLTKAVQEGRTSDIRAILQQANIDPATFTPEQAKTLLDKINPTAKGKKNERETLRAGGPF